MARLIYAALTSLDGYIADEAGKFDWAVPDEEVHAFINDLERPVGTYLYGRKMYETMAGWETPDTIPDRTPAMLDFAGIWQAAEKIVYSKSLPRVATANTRLEREFDPQVVRQIKARSSRDLAVGGPTLAAHAIRAKLVDEYHLFVTPVIVGGGNHSCLEMSVKRSSFWTSAISTTARSIFATERRPRDSSASTGRETSPASRLGPPAGGRSPARTPSSR